MMRRYKLERRANISDDPSSEAPPEPKPPRFRQESGKCKEVIISDGHDAPHLYLFRKAILGEAGFGRFYIGTERVGPKFDAPRLGVLHGTQTSRWHAPGRGPGDRRAASGTWRRPSRATPFTVKRLTPDRPGQRAGHG
ncbi:MAG TPA: hypothetical protein VFH51_20955 [Myxococcota bacterium]|nr:hypothetical protein [Myxococcota bacterium]